MLLIMHQALMLQIFLNIAMRLASRHNIAYAALSPL